MVTRFDKDLWIKIALKRRYLICKANGTVLRCIKADKNGNPASPTYKEVTMQIHKPTGRVYFNMSYLGYHKSVLLNRVICWAFHPNPQNLPQVNHIDGDRENNAASNLEWITGSDNERHAHRTGLKSGRGSSNSNAKLTSADVLEIRASEEKSEDLARRFGVSRSTIVNIKNGKTWTHV